MASQRTRPAAFMIFTAFLALSLLLGLTLLYQGDMALHRRWFGVPSSFLTLETRAMESHSSAISRMMVATGTLPRSKSTGFHIETRFPTENPETHFRLDVLHKYGIVPGTGFKGDITLTKEVLSPTVPATIEETPLASFHTIVQAEGTALQDAAGYFLKGDGIFSLEKDPLFLSTFPPSPWSISSERLRPFLSVTESTLEAFLVGFSNVALTHLAPYATYEAHQSVEGELQFTHASRLTEGPLDDFLHDMEAHLKRSTEASLIVMLLHGHPVDAPLFPGPDVGVDSLRYLHTRDKSGHTLHLLLEALALDGTVLFRLRYEHRPSPDGALVVEWVAPTRSLALVGSKTQRDLGQDFNLVLFQDGIPVKDYRGQEVASKDVTGYPVFTGNLDIQDHLHPERSLRVHASAEGPLYLLEKTIDGTTYTQRITKLKVRDSYVHGQDWSTIENDPKRFDALNTEFQNAWRLLR